MPKNKLAIKKTKFFIVEQCRTCDIPGYLIVSALSEVQFLASLPTNAAAELGILLADVERAISEIVKPENIYVAKFGEERRLLHFHVFPRIKEMTLKFISSQQQPSEVLCGPVMLNWARDFYKLSTSESHSIETLNVLKSLSEVLTQTS